MAKERFTSPVMRFVQGDVDTAQDKDSQGNPRLVKSGPNAGQPNPQFFVAGAIAKNDPAWPAFWATLVNAAFAGFPGLFPQGAAPVIAAGGPTLIPQGLVLHPAFAFKVADGDGMDSNGKPNNTKEGFAGHWVVRFGSAYPPRCFHAGRYAAHEQIQEKGAIKRGYFIRISGTAEGNGNAQRPGVYVNLDMVELSAFGPEIVSGPDATAAFGSAPTALPAGATAAPVTPATGAPAAPLAAPAPVAPPLPVVASPAPASPPVAPYTAYMDPNAAGAGAVAPPPPAPTAPTSPIASPIKAMLPAANGATYESMLAAGWTDETLVAHGMMAAA